MELRRRINTTAVFVFIYFSSLLTFLIIGLQPVEAAQYSVSGKLSIPSINLDTDVTSLALENDKLNTPDTIAGSYSNSDNKVLLIGHYVGIFKDLINVRLSDRIIYNNKSYSVIKLDYQEKSIVDMSEILKGENIDTIVLMTCAGTIHNNGDASHRYIVTAVAD